MPHKKKLIEVALPLEAINKASAREKSIRHGHPSTLHLWWARRPLAAARAVIFAQMVDDPSAWPDLFPTEKAQEKERRRLFKLIEELVQWENTTNEKVLQAARDEIWASWRRACAENADHPRVIRIFGAGPAPACPDLVARRLQDLLVRGVLPLDELLDELEEPPAFLLLGLLGRKEIGPCRGVVHHLGEDDRTCRGQRPPRPPEVQRGGVPVAYGLLPGRGLVDRLERQSDFDQFFLMRHCAASHIILHFTHSTP